MGSQKERIYTTQSFAGDPNLMEKMGEKNKGV
jgi:hypothetical protein